MNQTNFLSPLYYDEIVIFWFESSDKPVVLHIWCDKLLVDVILAHRVGVSSLSDFFQIIRLHPAQLEVKLVQTQHSD